MENSRYIRRKSLSGIPGIFCFHVSIKVYMRKVSEGEEKISIG